jgi:DNA mismatch repair protein MutH
VEPAPPRSIDELLARARALSGRTVASIADELCLSTEGEAVRTKGRPGEILERALGATGGPTKVVDFPDLGVELKTVPIDERGRPIETTYVCKITLGDADTQEWETSWVRAKLARVLFVPLLAPEGRPWPERIVGESVMWSPTPEEEIVLRADFDDAMGLIGVGRIEELTAHLGQWLQVRPKGRDGTKSGLAYGSENEAIATVPRGFYLRTTFTDRILRGRPS